MTKFDETGKLSQGEQGYDKLSRLHKLPKLRWGKRREYE